MKLSARDLITVAAAKLENAEEFLNLVNQNKEHLLNYFPITLGLVTSLQTAKDFLTHKIQNASKGQSYYFFMLYENKIAGVLSVKSINRSEQKCEIAYFVSEEKGGKGIATAGIKWLVTFCFEELKMAKIFAKINPENEASKKAIEKNGFVMEEIIKNDYSNGSGELTDSCYYTIVQK